MANIEIAVPHELPQEEATERIKGLLARLKDEHAEMIDDVSENWVGNTGGFNFTAKGFKIDGEIVVKPDKVAIKAQVPFFVSLFSSKISDMIKKEAGTLLAK
jgi:hypothetical protein